MSCNTFSQVLQKNGSLWRPQGLSDCFLRQMTDIRITVSAVDNTSDGLAFVPVFVNKR